jgi:asparagine synthase (glutamine-hydrolysing)
MTLASESDTSQFRGRRDVVVVTLAPTATQEADRWVDSARAALLTGCEDQASYWTSPRGGLAVIATGGLAPTGGPLAVGGSQAGGAPGAIPVTRSGHGQGPDRPPWAALELTGETARFVGDLVGLKHVYVTQGRGWAAGSTSALALARLAGSALDPVSWASQALLGFSVGTRTVATAVARVPAAHDVRLAEGRAHVVARSVTRPQIGSATGADVIRGVVGALLDEHPDVGLELSGGLDSRVLLAALPPEQRGGRAALTIGGADDPDVRIARRLALRFHLDHHVLPPPDAADLEPTVALSTALASGRRREHASDALAAWVLDDVESRAPRSPRLTGVNGEFVRGFYYPATPRHGPVTHARVARLARWRLFANHRAADWLLDGDWLKDHERGVIDLTSRTMRAYGLSWRPATDEYYLRERIPNWAGPGYSHAATQRLVLAPFTSQEFLAWARAMPYEHRAESRALVEALMMLEPALADLPLAAGPTPVAMTRRGALATVSRSARAGRRLVGKVRQRLRNERRPPTGAATLVPVVTRALRDEVVLEELAGVEFLDRVGLEQFAEGLATPDQPTASFLVNLLGTQRLLAGRAPITAGEHRPVRSGQEHSR